MSTPVTVCVLPVPGGPWMRVKGWVAGGEEEAAEAEVVLSGTVLPR